MSTESFLNKLPQSVIKDGQIIDIRTSIGEMLTVCTTYVSDFCCMVIVRLQLPTYFCKAVNYIEQHLKHNNPTNNVLPAVRLSQWSRLIG